MLIVSAHHLPYGPGATIICLLVLTPQRAVAISYHAMLKRTLCVIVTPDLCGVICVTQDEDLVVIIKLNSQEYLIPKSVISEKLLGQIYGMYTYCLICMIQKCQEIHFIFTYEHPGIDHNMSKLFSLLFY